jgi:Zn-dependent protease
MLALLGAIPFRLGLFSLDSAFIDTGWWPNPDKVFMYFVYINLLLMLFNLIPLAPLDGDKIVEYFLPPNIAVYFERIRPYGPMILFGLIALGNLGNVDVIGAIIDPPMRLLLRLLLV